MDEYTETTKQSLGQRFVESIWKVIIGLILFIGSFGWLYWNEGRIDLSKIAKTAVEINSEKLNTDPNLNEKLVFSTGTLNSPETIGDNQFLKEGKYLSFTRNVEMYSWQEHKEEKTEKHVGGSQTTKTTYSYTKEWKQNPADSNIFKQPTEHQNPIKTISDISNKVTTATIGVYKIDMTNIILPTPSGVYIKSSEWNSFIKEPQLQLTPQNTTLSNNATLENNYIYIPKTPGNSLQNPQIGDMRISYHVIPLEIETTILGKLKGDKISTYIDKNNKKTYRLFYGTSESAISQLRSEYLVEIWMFRVFGLFFMWVGLLLLFGPIITLLDIIPILGSLGNAITLLLTFITALILSIITIIVSMIFHSLIALLIAICVTIFLMIIVLLRMKKKRKQTLPPTSTF